MSKAVKIKGAHLVTVNGAEPVMIVHAKVCARVLLLGHARVVNATPAVRWALSGFSKRQVLYVDEASG